MHADAAHVERTHTLQGYGMVWWKWYIGGLLEHSQHMCNARVCAYWKITDKHYHLSFPNHANEILSAAAAAANRHTSHA